MNNDRFVFEFWSKELKRFASLDAQGLYVNFINGHIYTRDGSMNVTDRYIIRQSTGLRDKNGTLIFEGDILADVPKSELPMAIDDPDVVTWGEDGWILKNAGDNCIYWNECYVIGNIYENPELLESE